MRIPFRSLRKRRQEASKSVFVGFEKAETHCPWDGRLVEYMKMEWLPEAGNGNYPVRLHISCGHDIVISLDNGQEVYTWVEREET